MKGQESAAKVPVLEFPRERTYSTYRQQIGDDRLHHAVDRVVALLRVIGLEFEIGEVVARMAAIFALRASIASVISSARCSAAVKGTPPDKTGLIYMMTGDTGASNHDPYATDKSHWVVTGPHIMLVGKAARELAPMYPHTMDPDPAGPYVMFPDTPFQHLMIPVGVGMDHMK